MEKENKMYILYADIMGFKERVMRTEHLDLKKDFEALINDLDAWFKPNKNAATFKVSFFSDSILVVDTDTKYGFNRISKAAAGLMQVSLKHKFPLKGVLAKGNFTYEESKQLFFGQAIVDAYLLQEQVHFYGIVAHHSIERDIKRYANGWVERIKKKGINPYVLSLVPLKNGWSTHYHLAYNLISSKRETGKDVDKTNKDITSCLEVISETVSGSPRIYIDNTLKVLTEDLSIYTNNKDKIDFPLMDTH